MTVIHCGFNFSEVMENCNGKKFPCWIFSSNLRFVCGRGFFFSRWEGGCGADISAAGHLLGSSQDTRHDLALSSVFFFFFF